MTLQDRKNLNVIAQAIFDKKGFNILSLDVRGLSTMTDYLMIAEGTVDRHVKSLANFIKACISQTSLQIYRTDGEKDAEWVIIDCGDVIVHLFIPEMREKYHLEELWNKGKIVDLEINVPLANK